MNYMKKLIAGAFTMLIIAATVMSEEYSLADYLAKVAQHNTDYVLAQKEVALAKQSANQARSALLPSIGAQAGYTRNLNDRMQSTPVASSPLGGALIYQDVDSNRDNELTVGIGVNQTVFDAASWANYNKAKKALEIQTQVLETTRRNIENAAKKLYAGAQLAQTLVTISENSEATSREIYESIARKQRAGTATELDLLMAEVDWKSKIPATAQARKNAGVALIAFRDLAGIPHTEDIVLTESGDNIPDIPTAPELAAILAARPDYRALVLSRDISDIGKKAVYGSFLPKVTAGFSFAFGGMGDNSLTGDYDYTASSVTLGVSIPIFTGGYRLSVMKAASIEQDKAALNLAKKRTAIESEVAELSLRITEAWERINSARLVEAMAARAVSLAQSSYANGLATQLSVAEAINKHDQAGLGLQNALFEYRSAYYDWELVTGKIQ